MSVTLPLPAPESEPGPAQDAPLGRSRDFLALLVSQSVSAGGDAVSATALPLLVLALTGSGVAMGTVGAVTTIADFAMAAFAGALADRGDRKRMMLLADLGRAVLTALVPISVLLGGPTMVVILLVAGPLAILRAFFRAGYISSMPALVGRSQLARGNGLIETGVSVAFIAGPALAGLLVTLIGPGPTLALDAASFAISAVGIALIRRDLRAPAGRAPSRVVDDIREGFAYVDGHSVLRPVILFIAGASALLAPLGPALTFRVVRDLGEGPAAVGLAITALGVGTIAGSLIAARIGPGARAGRVLLVTIVVSGATTIGIGLVPSMVAVIALNAVGGAAEVVMMVLYVSIRAANSPDALTGRIGATGRVLALMFQPITVFIGGLLLDAVGGGATLVVFGVAACLLSLAFVPVAALQAASTAPRTAE